jgi:hypothetical protein
MGLLRNDERRSAPRAVKKPYRGVRPPVHAVAKRPVNASGNAVLDGVSGATRGRSEGNEA